MLSMGPGVFLFARIVKAGGGSKPAVIAGTACITLLFVIVTVAVAWATFRLEPRD
jgi:hypothetical protein